MPLVIISYILANVAYFLVLPLSTLNSSNTVAVMFGAKVFGPVGSLVIALLVSASCFGALNSSTFTSSRLVYAAGKEGYVPAVFGHIGLGAHTEHVRLGAATMHSQSRVGRALARWFGDEDTGLFYTPVAALVLNGLLTVAYVCVGEFGTLLTFYGVAGYSFYFVTVLGLIVLRVREPTLERPYKTWIVTPITFCCVSLFLLSRAVFAEPLQTMIVVVFVAAGVPVYFWRIRGRDQVVKREDGHGLAGGRATRAEEEKAPWWKFWNRSGR